MGKLRTRLPAWLCACLLIVSTGAMAERMVTEVLPVGYRDAGELAEILRPLVPPPGSVSSLYNQLIVKTTPAGMREVKQVLATLDRAPAYDPDTRRVERSVRELTTRGLAERPHVLIVRETTLDQDPATWVEIGP